MYLLRDRFDTDIDAGSLDGTAAEPGPGLRELTESPDRMYALGGRLRDGGYDLNEWGNSKILWTQADGSGIARIAGRTLATIFQPTDMTMDNNLAVGWATATDVVDPREDGLGFATGNAGEIDIATAGQRIDLFPADLDVLTSQYLVAVALNDIGGAVLLSTFGNDDRTVRRRGFSIPKYPRARLLWVDYADATAAMYPYVAYSHRVDPSLARGNSIEDMRVLAVPDWCEPDGLAGFADRFARSDSSAEIGNDWAAQGGTWGLTGGKAYLVAVGANGDYVATHGTGLADGDGVFQWHVTMPDVETPAFLLVYRWRDANNFFALRNTTVAGAYHRERLSIIKVVDGVTTNLGTLTVVNWPAGDTFRFVVMVEGGRHRVYYDKTPTGLDYSGHDEFSEAATMGIGINNAGVAGRYGTAGHRFDNVGAWPHIVTLPNAFSDGMTPTVLTPGAIISSCSLSGTPGASVAGTTDDQGHTWEAVNADWVFTDSGAVSPGAPEDATGTFVDLVVDLGVSDAEISVDLHIPTLEQFTNPDDPLLDPGHVPPRDGIDGYTNGMKAGPVGRFTGEGVGDSYIGVNACRAHYTPYTNEAEGTCIGFVPRKSQLGDFFTPGTTVRLKMQFKGEIVLFFVDDVPLTAYYADPENGAGTKFGLHAAWWRMRYVTFSNWEARAL